MVYFCVLVMQNKDINIIINYIRTVEIHNFLFLDLMHKLTYRKPKFQLIDPQSNDLFYVFGSNSKNLTFALQIGWSNTFQYISMILDSKEFFIVLNLWWNEQLFSKSCSPSSGFRIVCIRQHILLLFLDAKSTWFKFPIYIAD